MAAVSLFFLIGVASVLIFAAVIGVILVLVLRRPSSDTNSPRRPSAYSTPLDRAKAAALELTSEEWDDFRHWVEGPRKPAVGHGDGVIQSPQ